MSEKERSVKVPRSGAGVAGARDHFVVEAFVLLHIVHYVATALAKLFAIVVDLVDFGAFQSGVCARFVHLVAELAANGETLFAVELVLVWRANVAHQTVDVLLTKF